MKTAIKLRVRGTNNNPLNADVEISIDGEVWNDAIISRMELIIDANTDECVLRIDFPEFDIDVDDIEVPIRPINQSRIDKLRRFLGIVDKKE